MQTCKQNARSVRQCGYCSCGYDISLAADRWRPVSSFAANEMRIQVLFGETQVLVPCGDGKITVGELIEKAITRYRKVTNKVSREK